ncbi:MAG: hypothetical protein EXR29_10985 [Betaproteobacteria bacterium]|nr:hypothetical protein [Betaproteobacteria bacterium]
MTVSEAPTHATVPGAGKRDAVWQTWIVSGVLGFLYGALASPIWIETVEFGQVIAGLVAYPLNNAWYYEVTSSPTLLTFIPAILLKLGIPEWPLCVAFTGVLASLAFSAVALTSLIFCESALFACLVPLFLLNYGFANIHYYPVVFPISLFCFGQFGCFLALLILSLFCLGKTRVATFLLGLMPALHASWAIAGWIGGAALIWNERRNLDTGAHFRLFLTGFALVLAALWAQNAIFPPQGADAGTTYDRAVQLSEMKAVRDVWAQRNEDGNPSSHNLLIKEAPNPGREFLRYFSSELYVLFFAALAWVWFRPYWLGPRQRLFVGVWAISLAAIGIRALDESDRHMTILASIYDYLPYFTQRLIVSRWLNLDLILIPVLVLSVLGYLAIRKHSLFAVLVLLFGSYVIPRKSSWSFVPVSVDAGTLRDTIQLVPLLLLACLLVARNQKLQSLAIEARLKIERHAPEMVRRVKGLPPHLVIGLLFVAAFVFANRASVGDIVEKKAVLGHDRYDALADAARRTSGVLLLAPGLKGVNGFNPQLRTGRAVMVPGPIVIKGPNADLAKSRQANQQIYCLDPFDAKAPFYFTQRLKDCFESRDVAGWQMLRMQHQTTSVLAPDSWKLKLPLEISAAGLSLYNIP